MFTFNTLYNGYFPNDTNYVTAMAASQSANLIYFKLAMLKEKTCSLLTTYTNFFKVM